MKSAPLHLAHCLVCYHSKYPGIQIYEQNFHLLTSLCMHKHSQTFHIFGDNEKVIKYKLRIKNNMSYLHWEFGGGTPQERKNRKLETAVSQ